MSRAIINSMNYEELKRQIGKAGLTNKAFAELIGINPKSITNFKVRGVVPGHIAIIATLCAEMADRKIDYKEVIGRLGMGNEGRR